MGVGVGANIFFNMYPQQGWVGYMLEQINVCRCSKSDNSKEKHERKLEDKRKDYIYLKETIANEGEITKIKEIIKMEKTN